MVSCEGVFTTEAQSYQSSEYFLINNSLLRALRASAGQFLSPASQESLKTLSLRFRWLGSLIRYLEVSYNETTANSGPASAQYSRETFHQSFRNIAFL